MGYADDQTAATPSLRQRLHADETVVGMWSVVTSPTVVEIAANAGMDFVLLDGEHGVWQGALLEQGIRACETGKGSGGSVATCAPLVRVPGGDLFATQSALDLGAAGVVIPQVGSYDEALAAARNARFHPHGTRGYNPFTRFGSYGQRPSAVEQGADETVVVLIIETLGALADLARLVTLDEIDVFYLGVYDMSVALGCAGDVGHPRVRAFVREAIPVIRDAGKTVGLMVHDTAPVEDYQDLGVRFFVYSVDSFLISKTLGGAVSAFRTAASAVAPALEFTPPSIDQRD